MGICSAPFGPSLRSGCDEKRIKRHHLVLRDGIMYDMRLAISEPRESFFVCKSIVKV